MPNSLGSSKDFTWNLNVRPFASLTVPLVQFPFFVFSVIRVFILFALSFEVAPSPSRGAGTFAYASSVAFLAFLRLRIWKAR